ncbi:kinesin-domain-containing protein [Neoconidiobolus thromboides FSU 785]|nr:kinesin-domain-containing protein [Neoconidiobolus thromboides FSU 785]
MSNNIKVVCRFRPQNSIELSANGKVITSFEKEADTVSLGIDKELNESNTFTFDKLFGPDSTQSEVFEYSIKSTVDDVLKGYNGTVFAYGQTGSGKTFTMMGANTGQEEFKGIIPRIVESIFTHIIDSPDSLEYTVNVSYMEIYMEKIRDLLNPQNDNLPIHEEKNRGVYVKGLMEVYVSSIDEVYEVMSKGIKSRAVAHTNMNAESSRSHSIFVITINQKNLLDGGSVKRGRLYLVDLAGSEKVGKTGASGQTLEEAKKINKSLSSLGMVINALTDGKSSHVPYRDSKLTRILQESLGGNSRTTLIINCSPSSFNEAETLSTLRFGMRAKKIKNKAKINQDLSPAELKALLKKANTQIITFQQYIKLLEEELNIWRNGGNVTKENFATADKLNLAISRPSITHSRSKSYDIMNGPLSDTPNGSGTSTPSLTSPSNVTQVVQPNWTIPSPLAEEEKEMYLQRENQLMDSLAEKEDEIAELHQTMEKYEKEIEQFEMEKMKQMEQENQIMKLEINQMKLENDTMKYENEEMKINYDSILEKCQSLERNLKESLKRVEELENINESSGDKRKERMHNKRVEKIVKMMTTSKSVIAAGNHEKEIRDTLDDLERLKENQPVSNKDIVKLRNQMNELQTQVKEKDLSIKNLIMDQQMLQEKNNLLNEKYNNVNKEYEQLLTKSHFKDHVSFEEIKNKLEDQYDLKTQTLKEEIEHQKQRFDIKEKECLELMENSKLITKENDELKNQIEYYIKLDPTGTNVMVMELKEKMALQLNEFEKHKEMLAKELDARCNKVAELEEILNDSQKEYQQSIKERKKAAINKKRLNTIDNFVQKLSHVHHTLVEQNHMLKKESSNLERKLNTRSERIACLEKLLEESTNKLKLQAEKFELQFKMINEKNKIKPSFIYPKGQVNNGQKLNNQQQGFTRIAKPLRGGGKVN